MCALVYMCQHPTSVSMYPCPLCQPFGTLGCFFPGLEAGASHWSYSRSRAAFLTDSLLGIHRFFPFSSFFSLRFSNPRLVPAAVRGWDCAATWRRDRGKPGRSVPLLGKSVFLLPLAALRLSKNPINKQISPLPPPPKKTNERREAQRHCRHLPESWSCLLGKGFYWMFCVPFYNYR